MTESPHDATPYETLGVGPTASPDDLRRAYLAMARKTHPDMGGSVADFRRVQAAWEMVGTPQAREEYDRRRRYSSPYTPTVSSTDWAQGRSGTSGPTRSTRARSFGHPGGSAREEYRALMEEWVGRGHGVTDLYDPDLIRGAPREIRQLLADALAQEATARILSDLGLGFTIWNSVAPLAPTASALDHVVLSPAGLFALHSADWGSVLKIVRGELSGAHLPENITPLRDLSRRAKTWSRHTGVRFTSLIVVVPDDTLALPLEQASAGRHAPAIVARRSVLPLILRDGARGVGRESVDRSFDIRTRINETVRFV